MKPGACGVTEWKCVKHKAIWLIEKVIENGTRISLNKINEILDILQEECAEVIQAISKCRRFGIEEQNLKTGRTQREELVQELGDVSLLLELLHAHQLFTESELNQAKLNKANKLVIWSSIYESDECQKKKVNIK